MKTWIIADQIFPGSSLLSIEDPNITVLKYDMIPHDLVFGPTDKICLTSECCLNSIITRISNQSMLNMIEIFKDKHLFRQLVSNLYPSMLFSKVNISEIPNLVLENGRDYVIKPIKGYFGSGVRIINTETDLFLTKDSIIHELNSRSHLFSNEIVSTQDFILEDYIDGEEYAIDMYYDAQGIPVILNIYHHIIPHNLLYKDSLYYSNMSVHNSIFNLAYAFFEKLGAYLKISSFPLHGEFKLGSKGFVPIEINPLRFGSDGLYDLSFHSYGINQFVAFAHDQRVFWSNIWNNVNSSKYYIFFFAYNGLGFNHTIHQHDVDSLMKSFNNIIGTILFSNREYIGHRVIYSEENSFERLKELANIDFEKFYN